MAGGDSVDPSQFKGLARYFNSHTIQGRANVATATLGSIAVLILYNKLKPKKKPVESK